MFLALDGEGPVPELLWISRICEEFGCLPSAALREWLASPAGLIEELLLIRAFASAKKQLAETPRKDLPQDSPLIDLAAEIELELVAEARAGRRD